MDYEISCDNVAFSIVAERIALPIEVSNSINPHDLTVEVHLGQSASVDVTLIIRNMLNQNVTIRVRRSSMHALDPSISPDITLIVYAGNSERIYWGKQEVHVGEEDVTLTTLSGTFYIRFQFVP